MSSWSSEAAFLAELRGLFHREFGRADPTVRIRAPGRVNLVGEHIDYNGLPVLPMAIQQAVWMEARPRGDADIRVVNLDRSYPAVRFTLGASIPAAPGGPWGNYLQAAAQALVEDHGELRGCDIAVASTLPPAAGLSSSSALVIATALALLAVNDLSAEPLVLAERLAEAERYVGTESGGMDQAICLMARAGTASRIDFLPLRTRPLLIPSDWVFVVANSGTLAKKAGAARTIYNRRTRECARALARIAEHLALSSEGCSYRGLAAGHAQEDLLASAERALEPTLARRFRHVITEASRVDRAERSLSAGDSGGFGRILSESHASLRDDYEVSTPDLDRICAAAEGAGALGARLTGAGLGGCAIALCEPPSAEAVLEALRRVATSAATQPFIADPAAGAAIAPLQ